ncbi:MAG: hypothetical protein K9L21_05515 [Spirochaetia bacterium]|nr:hypothetical protein [Spirochaetia bacterium]
MKQLLITVLCLFLTAVGGLVSAEAGVSAADSVPTGADDAIRLGLFADLGASDFIVSDHLYLRGGARIEVTDGFVMDLPITAVFNLNRADTAAEDDYVLLDIGILLKYYPGNGNFWTGISLFQGVGFIGDKLPEQQYHYMAELVFGYTLALPNGFYIEPSIIVRDPLGTFGDSLDYIQDLVPGYGDYRVGLAVGWIPWSFF